MKSVGGELKRTNNLIKRLFQGCSKDDKNSQYTYMCRKITGYLYCNREKDVFQKDIEKEFSLRRSSASKLIDSLEEKGLVIRKAVESDKRLKKIVLTSLAISNCEEFIKQMDAFEKMLTDGLTKDDIDEFLRIIDIVQKNIQKSANKSINE